MCYSVYMEKNDIVSESKFPSYAILWSTSFYKYRERVMLVRYILLIVCLRCYLIFASSFLQITWWRHQMETFSALLAICAGNSPVPGEFPSQRPVGPVNSNDKGQWRGALMFSLICAWINGWVNNRKAGDWRHTRAHYDVIVMQALADDNFHYDDRDKTVTTSCCHHRNRYMSS